MKLVKLAGATSEIWQVFVQDSSSTTGAGLAGLVFNSGSLTAYYHRDTDTTATAISLVTMTVGTFTSSGFKEIDATNMPGWYQFCPPNAALASGAKSCAIHLKGAANMAPLPLEVQLTAINPDSTGFGLSNASANVAQWNGTNVSSPATAGIPEVNVKNINNVAATSVTTVNANIGTTQPLNFTGTAGSALVKSDMVDVAGAAVSTSSAQIGINVVNYGGGAVPATNVTGVPLVDLKYTLGTISPATAGSVRADAVTGSVGSVTGAVGSVTGNVGGNVAGSVGSVFGAVGSVTGSVGSVTGAVGSVTAGVSLTSAERNSTADALLDRTSGVETNFTPRQTLRLVLSSVVAKLSGAATTTVAIRDINDTKDRITATVDSNGNRTAVTTDVT